MAYCRWALGREGSACCRGVAHDACGCGSYLLAELRGGNGKRNKKERTDAIVMPRDSASVKSDACVHGGCWCVRQRCEVLLAMTCCVTPDGQRGGLPELDEFPLALRQGCTQAREESMH